MGARVKGEDTNLTFSTPTGPAEGMDLIESWEATLQIEIMRQGYIGETTDRRDEVFRGCAGQCVLHMESAGYFRFTQLVQDRAQRRSPAAGKFNVTSSIKFNDGSRVRLTFEDVKFGELPLRTPGRSDHMAGTISWECETIRRVF